VDHRHERTGRLRLDAIVPADLDELHSLHADAEVWHHSPSGRHADRDRTVTVVSQVEAKRTAERAGLKLAWRGPDAGNPDPEAVRLVYADRALAADVIDAITQ
jgi:hypothetical protein